MMKTSMKRVWLKSCLANSIIWKKGIPRKKKQGLHEIKVLPTKSKIQATFIYQPTYIVKSSLLTERARKLQSFLHNNNWTPINHERREPG
jgi:hypothetical protein